MLLVATAEQGVRVEVVGAGVPSVVVTVPYERVTILGWKNGREAHRIRAHGVVEEVGRGLVRAVLILKLHIQFHRDLGRLGRLGRDVALEHILFVVEVHVQKSVLRLLDDTVLIVDRGVEEVVDASFRRHAARH